MNTLDLLIQIKELYVRKHLAGRHNQRVHGHRYGATATYSYMKQRRADLTSEEWEDYKQRARKKRDEASTKLKAYIQKRKELGTDVNLSEEGKKDFMEALDYIQPSKTYDKASQVPNSAYHTKYRDYNSKGYIITPDGKLVSISEEFGGGSNDHVGFMTLSSDPKLFGLTDKDANNLLASYMDMTTDSLDYMTEVWDKMHSKGNVRVRQFGNDTYIETSKVDSATLRKLQKLYDSGKLEFNPKGKNVWDGGAGEQYVEFSYGNFLGAKYVSDLRSGPIEYE